MDRLANGQAIPNISTHHYSQPGNRQQPVTLPTLSLTQPGLLYYKVRAPISTKKTLEEEKKV